MPRASRDSRPHARKPIQELGSVTRRGSFWHVAAHTREPSRRRTDRPRYTLYLEYWQSTVGFQKSHIALSLFCRYPTGSLDSTFDDPTVKR